MIKVENASADSVIKFIFKDWENENGVVEMPVKNLIDLKSI
jgi:hypothetical protein